MRNRIKQDDSGFTLVEIVITITVLAIITVPLLSYFTDSVRHSARTKQQQNAVVLAQNTLEELRLGRQDLSDPNTILNPGPSATPLASAIPWQLATTALPAQTKDPVTGHRYYPTYQLYRNASENGQSYLVKLDVTPKYKVESSASPRYYEDVIVPSMDSSVDMMARETTEIQMDAENYYRSVFHAAGIPISSGSVESKMERTIRVKLQKEPAPPGSSAGPAVRVDVSINYECTQPGIPDEKKFLNKQISSQTFDDPKQLRNIFVFYNPSEQGETLDFGSLDTTYDTSGVSEYASTLKNDLGMKDDQLKLYLIAQNSVPYDSVPVPSTEPKRRDANYKLEIGPESKDPRGIRTFFSDIYTNLTKSNGASNDEITATGEFLNKIYVDSTTSDYSLVTKETMDRLVDVTVSVYRDDGTEAKQVFANPDSKYLTQVKGAVVLK